MKLMRKVTTKNKHHLRNKEDRKQVIKNYQLKKGLEKNIEIDENKNTKIKI